MKLHTHKLRILNAFNTADLKILKNANTEVEEITPAIKTIIRNMHHTLEKNSTGVGLAAPQIGVNKRIFVIHYAGCKMTVINPIILHTDTSMKVVNEGCLSVPGIHTPIARSENIRVSFTDMNSERITDCPLNGFLSRIFQHEYNHLEGVLIVNFSTEDNFTI